VLPVSARLTSPQDFARTTKSGLRVTSEHFVGYLHITPVTNNSGVNKNPRAGLIIGKVVGGSVRRHRVSRQIRHALAPQLENFPEGSLIVIRGLKQSASVDVQGEVAEISSRLIAKAAKRMASV
jgi:ribonuclease P protein component